MFQFLQFFSLISIVIVTGLPASACHFTVGTYEANYITFKNEIFKGNILYGKGNAYGYNYPLKLRIKNPDGDIIYYSNESKHVVYGEFFINDTTKTGNWFIQLGIYKIGWQWSTDSGRFSSFIVEDINFSLAITLDGNG